MSTRILKVVSCLVSDSQDELAAQVNSQVTIIHAETRYQKCFPRLRLIHSRRSP